MIGSTHRHNCFDLIRHVAALTVLVSHQSALNKLPIPKFFGIFSYGAFAVLIFFAISGYLVTRSFCQSSSFWSYFEKRIRRLFPGLIVCSALMLIVLCGFMGDLLPLDFLFSEGAYHSFMSSVWMEGAGNINHFAHNFKYPNAINGSLWTLRYEFFAYLIVPISMIIFGKSVRVILAILVASIAIQLYAAFGYPPIVSIFRQALLMVPFAMGAILFLTQDRWDNSASKWTMTILCLLVLFGPRNAFMQPFFYVALSALTVLIGLGFKENIIAGKFDISYGIYIYAFPIQQLMINKTTLDFYGSMAASAVMTIIFATASWHLVEKPFLKRRQDAKKDNPDSGDIVIPTPELIPPCPLTP